MNKNDIHLFNIARECSLQSDYCGHARIGCVAVYHGAVIAKGWNTDKTHTMQSIYNIKRFKNNGNKYLPDKCHAETHVLTKIRYLDIEWSKVQLYIYRELRNGNLALAKPCPACLAAIRALHIKHLNYTTYNGYCKEELV